MVRQYNTILVKETSFEPIRCCETKQQILAETTNRYQIEFESSTLYLKVEN